MRYLYAFWSMGRPLFLLGSLPLYMLGVSLAWSEGYRIQLSISVLGLVLAWLVQLATHYNNEYRDLATDKAVETPTRISGGSRVLVKGLVHPKSARFGGIVAFVAAVAVALILVLVLDSGYLSLLFASVALIIGWGYSEPPIKLDSRGLGESGIVLLSCFLLPATAYYLQTSTLSLTLLFLGIPLALITFAVTLATEVPDIAPDQSTGKITLAVRMHRRNSVKLHVALFITGCLSLVALLFYLNSITALVSVVVFALAIIAGLAGAKASIEGEIQAMERIGLLYSFVLGFGAVAFSAALFLATR